MESTMCFFVAPPWVWFSQAGNLQPVHEQFFPMYLLSVPEALNFGGIFFWCLEMPEPMPIEWDLWVNAVKLFEDKILLASFGPKSCTGWFREYLYLIYHIYIYLFIFTGQSFLSVPTGVHQTVWPVRIQNWPFGITLVSQRVVVTDAFFFGGSVIPNDGFDRKLFWVFMEYPPQNWLISFPRHFWRSVSQGLIMIC